MNRVVGGSLPADIWHDVMLAAHNGRQPAPLQGVVTSSLPQAAPPQAPAAHPQEAIGDDFIARALQETEAPADDGRSRAEAREPQDGRMSLGRFGD
jgi:penicillin-binding protein 1A